MIKDIFVNLPVKDLNKSVEFWTKLGFKFNPTYTDENATCMIIAENIYVMLLVEPFFKTFTTKEIADASKTAEVIMAVSAESKEEVDAMVKNAISAGGKEYNEPKDYGFMYSHSFQDIDNHLWEVIYSSGEPPKN